MPLALTFYSVVLFVHIAAVVIGFGVIFTFPLMGALARREPRHEAAIRRAQALIGGRVIGPSLGVILIAGIYLASKLHVWGEFWVIFPLLSLVGIGALGGAVLGPWEDRAADLAERDAEATPPGQAVAMSAEQRALAGRLERLQALVAVWVLVVIYVMTTKPFA